MLKLKTNKYFLLILIFSIFFSLYFSWYTILRHRALYTAYFDLGIMDQTVYNTSRGRILQLTDPHGTDAIYRMAIHNDVFLALLAPIYWIWQSPEALLIVQSFIVGTGAIALFLISNKVINNQAISVLIGVTYLLYPALHGAILFDFHAVTLATSFILWMFYFLLKKKRALMIFFLLLALSTKENVGLTVGTLLLIQIINNEQLTINKLIIKIKKNKTFILLSIFCLFWSLISFFIVIPYFRQGEHLILGRYADIGSSPSEIIINIIKDPNIILRAFTSNDAMAYYIRLFAPLGYIPILSPLWLMAILPDMFINLLSSNWGTKTIMYHYTALITPIIFIALIYGIRKMIQWKVLNVVISCFLIFSSLYSWRSFGHVPFVDKTLLKQPIEYEKLTNWAKKLKDESIIVSGSNHTSPHLTQRKVFHYFPDGYEYSDYIVIMTNDIYNDWKDKKASIAGYEKLKKDPNFELVERFKRLEVYKRFKI